MIFKEKASSGGSSVVVALFAVVVAALVSPSLGGEFWFFNQLLLGPSGSSTYGYGLDMRQDVMLVADVNQFRFQVCIRNESLHPFTPFQLISVENEVSSCALNRQQDWTLEFNENHTFVCGCSSCNNGRGRGFIYRFNGSLFELSATLNAHNGDAKITTPTPVPYTGDSLGASCAMSGDAVMLGASIEHSCDTGTFTGASLSGSGADDSCPKMGAVYSFRHTANPPGTWSEVAYLKPMQAFPSPPPPDFHGFYFGYDLDMNQDATVLVVGASSSADNRTRDFLHIFERANTTTDEWLETNRFYTLGASFSVAIDDDGTSIVVGSRYHNSSTNDAAGGDYVQNSGAVHFITRANKSVAWNDSTASSFVTMKPPTVHFSASFGHSVAISNSLAVVGEFSYANSNGSYYGNGKQCGGAHIFQRSSSFNGQSYDDWQYQQHVLDIFDNGSCEASSQFGYRVAIDDETTTVALSSITYNGTGAVVAYRYIAPTTSPTESPTKLPTKSPTTSPSFSHSASPTSSPTQTPPLLPFNAQRSDDDKATTRIIVASFASFGFILVVIISLVFYRAHRRRQRALHDDASIALACVPTTTTMTTTTASTSSLPVLTAKSVKRGEKLGEGSFGVVWRGEYRAAKTKEWTAVAIKGLKAVDERAMAEFDREAKISASVPPHPNVVRVIGIIEEVMPKNLVLELCSRGSLEQFLSSPTSVVDGRLKGSFATQCARGVEHLHANNLIHRDLAARNVLLSDSDRLYGGLVCKLTDFGLAREKDEETYYQATKTSIGPIRWMAPEQMQSKTEMQFSTHSDVFSFGVLCYEICSRQRPWGDLSNLEVGSAILNGQRLELTGGEEEAPAPIPDIMRRCFVTKPSERPKMKAIVLELDAMFQIEPVLPTDFDAVDTVDGYSQPPLHQKAKRSGGNGGDGGDDYSAPALHRDENNYV